MDQNLCGTFLTGSKILSLLRSSPQAHVNGHKLETVEASVIGDGQGFCSKILRIHLKWSTGKNNSNPPPPQSIVIKVIGSTSTGEIFDTMGAEEAAKIINQIRRIHDVECAVYDLDELSTVMNLPICYFRLLNTADQPGIMALEDLSDRAVSIPAKQFGIGINKAQMDQMLEAQSTLHAWSVNTSVDWRRTIPKDEHFVMMSSICNQLPGMYEKSKESYPHAFENVDEAKLLTYLNFEKFLSVYGCDPKARYDLPRVLLHGDVHMTNALWEKLEDGSPSDRLVALIDWQVTHPGCAMEDVARLLTLALSVEMRRKYKDYVLNKYVEVRLAGGSVKCGGCPD